MTSVIQLAKPYNFSKLRFPVMVSEKLDGVPALIHITIKEDIYPPATKPSKRVIFTQQTRSGKPYPSITAQVAGFGDYLMHIGCMGTFVFVAEVTSTDSTLPFKDVSGLCRRKEQCDDLVLNVFDFYRPSIGNEMMHMPFGKRILLAKTLVHGMFWIKLVPQILCRDAIEMATALGQMKKARGDFIPEGAVIRNCDEKWQPGKRTWGYQKVVDDPTIELYVDSFIEAVSQTGEPLNRVGAICALYNSRFINIGAGKMTHEEATTIWEDQKAGHLQSKYHNRRFTVKYKRDPSYKSLRQPTFQHWRPE